MEILKKRFDKNEYPAKKIVGTRRVLKCVFTIMMVANLAVLASCGKKADNNTESSTAAAESTIVQADDAPAPGEAPIIPGIYTGGEGYIGTGKKNLVFRGGKGAVTIAHKTRISNGYENVINESGVEDIDYTDNMEVSINKGDRVFIEGEPDFYILLK